MSNNKSELLDNYDVYVGSSRMNIVSHIHNDSVENNITIEMVPIGMVQINNESGNFIYVFSKDSIIYIINVEDNQIHGTIKLPGLLDNHNNHNIALSHNQSTLYVANSNPDSGTGGWISVIDIRQHTLKNSIQVKGNPIGLSLTHGEYEGTEKLYVISKGAHSLSIIDTSNEEVLKSFFLSLDEPQNLTITPDNKYFIIGYKSSGKLHVGDIQTDSVIKSIYSNKAKTHCLAISMDGTLLYVCGKRSTSDKGQDKTELRIYDISNGFRFVRVMTLNDKSTDPRMIIECKNDDDFTSIFVSAEYSHKKVYLYKIVRDIHVNSFILKNSREFSNEFNGFFAMTHDSKYIVTANPYRNSISYVDAESFKSEGIIRLRKYPDTLLVVDSSHIQPLKSISEVQIVENDKIDNLSDDYDDNN
ncbi:YncE family protein [Wukongibacter baidiensis]|uniref:YncE family protein n=1 Tax=Wukongibacter baidiensis TaxID=1723361 RepID=UPI003D7FB8A9